VIVRVRIFAQDGTVIFSSDGADHPGATKSVDPDAVRSAAGGAATSVVAIDRVSLGGGRSSSLELLHTYVRLQGTKGKPSGAVSVDQRYQPIEAASQQPWHTAELGLAAAAVVFLMVTLLLLSWRLSVKRARTRAHSRPASPPGTPTQRGDDQAAPKPEPKRRSFRKDKQKTSPDSKEEAERAEKNAQREIQVREALETQLEQLRTRIREQEDQAGRHVLELTQQLQVAAVRGAGSGVWSPHRGRVVPAPERPLVEGGRAGEQSVGPGPADRCTGDRARRSLEAPPTRHDHQASEPTPERRPRRRCDRPRSDLRAGRDRHLLVGRCGPSRGDEVRRP